MQRIVLDPEWTEKPRVRSPEQLTKDANHAYSLLRQFQTDNNVLRSQIIKAERRLKFWRNLTLTLLGGAWTILLAILKAVAPALLKSVLH